MPTPDNRILGQKYRLVRQLDEGGMGSVWLAEHLALHSPVAIKLITQEIADTEEAVQRFLREARAAASLRSPHVVQILDYGVEDATPYIVMELLDGESLARRLERLKRLSLPETELILRHVARAVARAHDAGIVHRDLKPANIFIIRNEDEELVKLLDFGIAKAAVDVLGASIASSTRTGAFLGTPFYVSPEQAEGSKNLDHRTDIWSMGVIAFECLIGGQPFRGDTFGSLVLAICSRPMPVPSQQGPAPPGFDAWFARACERDVEQRFASAREAAAALRQLLEPDTTDGSPPTRHSQGAPLLGTDRGVEISLPPLEASAGAEAPRSWPASQFGNTTGVASSSATTRRRAVRLNTRMLTLAAGGALLLLVVGIGLASLRRQPDQGEQRASGAAVSVPEVKLPRLEATPGAARESAAASPSPAAPGSVPAAPSVSVAPIAPASSSQVSAAPNVAPIKAPAPAPPTEPSRTRAPAAKPARPRALAVPGNASNPALGARPARAPVKVQPSPAETTPAPEKPPGKYGVNLGI